MASDLFYDGDSFTQSAFRKQFVNGNKLNENKTLGWSFSVSISGIGEEATATITCIKG